MFIRYEQELGTDIQNTRNRDLRPEPNDPFVSLDAIAGKRADFELLPVMLGETFRRIVQYPVIVESWEKAKFGRGKREWEKQFNQAERRKIASYHGRFHRWHLVSGTPDHVSLQLGTLRLLIRAVQFFATI